MVFKEIIIIRILFDVNRFNLITRTTPHSITDQTVIPEFAHQGQEKQTLRTSVEIHLLYSPHRLIVFFQICLPVPDSRIVRRHQKGPHIDPTGHRHPLRNFIRPCRRTVT